MSLTVTVHPTQTTNDNRQTEHIAVLMSQNVFQHVIVSLLSGSEYKEISRIGLALFSRCQFCTFSLSQEISTQKLKLELELSVFIFSKFESFLPSIKLKLKTVFDIT